MSESSPDGKVCLAYTYEHQDTFCAVPTNHSGHHDELQNTLLMWGPCTFLWVALPFYVLHRMGLGKQPLPSNYLAKLKMCITVFLASLSFYQMTRQGHRADTLSQWEGQHSFHGAQLSTMILVAIISAVERRRGQIFSVTISAFWGLMLVTSSFSLYNNVIKETYTSDLVEFVLIASTVTAVLLQFIFSFARENQIRSFDKVGAHPEEQASILSQITFNWMTSYLWNGYKNEFKEEDVLPIKTKDKCEAQYPVFAKIWKKEQDKNVYCDIASLQKDDKTMDKEKVGPKQQLRVKASLLRAIYQTYGVKFLSLQFIKSILNMSGFIQPLLMQSFILYIQNRDTESKWKGYATVFGLFLYPLFNGIFDRFLWHHMLNISEKAKLTLQMAIYRKSLTARNEGKKDTTTGEIVALVSDDCTKVCDAVRDIYFIILTPMQACLAFYMLHEQLGAGAFVGSAMMLALIPISSLVGKKLKNLELSINEVKEKRMKLMNEVLNGIKVLKLYAWENSFIKKVRDIRDEESTMRKKICILHACIDGMFRTIPFLVRLTGVFTFIILGGYLDPAKAFVTASLFEILNDPFSVMAIIIPRFVQAHVSLKKINKYLNLEDIPDDVVTKNPETDAAVSIENGTFTWDRSNAKNCLKNINLTVPKGSLVAVVGMVGSGKSSLLSAMLGEMEKVEGKVNVQGTIAYVPQEAWIQNTTLRNNVLFGSDMDYKKYNQIIDGCALRDDFKILKAGEQTEIGEKGINLSGGQKQRVSMARAVYNDADVYMCDDPLSAVDAHVGKHIFNNIIGHNGMLKNKTRVLVTHGVHWLPFVDSVIVIKDGEISETGTYKQLLKHDGAFAQFVKEVFNHKEEVNDPEVQHIQQKMYVRLASLNDEDAVNENSDTSSEEENFEVNEKQPDKVDSNSEDKASLTDNKDEESNYDDSKEEDGKLVDEEDIEYGTVKKHVYMSYLRSVGFGHIILFSMLFALLLVSDYAGSLWMAKWSDDTLLANQSLIGTEEYAETNWKYITIYALIGGVEVVTSFVYITLVLIRGCEAANFHHNALLRNILRSPMSFFDTTPTGRIINRFSKDIAAVDGLGGCLRGYICSFGHLVSTVILIIIITPFILPFLIPLLILHSFVQRIFASANRQLRRFITKARSPIFVHLTETLNGAASIRTYGVEKTFTSKMEEHMERLFRSQSTMWSVHMWYGTRVTVLTSFMTLASGLLLIWSQTLSAGMAAAVLMYATSCCHCLGWFFNHAVHTETELVSLEKVLEYSNTPTEAAWEHAEEVAEAAWPTSGDLVMNEYKTRYRDGLDLVLKGVSCKITSGEKIGIVGRTGAGKSSLTVALFRLVEAAAGDILVDDQSIAPLGLHNLRNNITILPQDPVIFGGSLRMNLDPFEERSTEELWDALKNAHLLNFVKDLPEGLDYECGEFGKNLSVGQRQLVCLARTLLRKTKILVLDEATAAVDMETDELIQKTICEKFSDCTVLTIAHRLNTIMDYDRIMVLDQGLVKEFDSPKNLLADPSSTFYGMAKDANLV